MCAGVVSMMTVQVQTKVQSLMRHAAQQPRLESVQQGHNPRANAPGQEGESNPEAREMQGCHGSTGSTILN